MEWKIGGCNEQKGEKKKDDKVKMIYNSNINVRSLSHLMRGSTKINTKSSIIRWICS